MNINELKDFQIQRVIGFIEESYSETIAEKFVALALHLDLTLRELLVDNELEVDSDDITFTYGRNEYKVMTDEEAGEAAQEYIEDSLWAFNADFIIGECGLDYSGVKSLQKMQQDSCEGANDFIRSLIDKCTSIESFVESAISADGRGHFLSGYDGNENEEKVNGAWYYIYRTN